VMKKILVAMCLAGVVLVFAGCQSPEIKTNTDNADSATISDTSSDASDIGNPPVPPEPTQPAE